MICEHCGVDKKVTLALTGPDGKTWNLCVMHWLDGAFSKKGEEKKTPEQAAAEMKGKPAGKSLLTDNEYFYTGESRPRVPSEPPKKKARSKAKDETGQRDAFDDHPNAPGRK